MGTEKRLIDADALMRIYQEVLCPHVRCVDCSLLMDDGTCRFETMISEALTIDAVPVVRCKDCRHMEKSQYGRYCQIWGMDDGAGDDGFCSYGERKEGSE